ncbi:MAG: sulfurtransferase complex subunit TusD [Methylococcales bacterium]|jgi:tRNA 2-thiouridine synthesizing protein D|nr:sulfurtransferase complex subunit TusD [Methylococcales bacterium]
MKFAVQINSSPYAGAAGEMGYQFILAALASGHSVLQIFFYFDGIYHGLAAQLPPDDERQFLRRWSQLSQQHGIDLVICISAAQRRGLLSLEESRRQNRIDQDLAPGFRISGLGQLVEATINADRFIVFPGA